MSMTDDAIITYIDANVSKLEEKFKKSTKDLDSYKRKHEETADGIEKLWGKTNIGEALDKIFDKTRFAVFEEGATKIPIFGSALEALGPAGLAAAAGLAAVAIGYEKIKEAAEQVGTLKIQSDTLGIPVEELQKWQFISAASHVTNDQLNQSFMGLSDTLGKLKSGIRDQRVKPFLDELGISDADIAKAQNAGDLLDLIMSKMDKIKDPGERIQIADAFGFESMLPVLNKSRSEIQGLTDDFHKNAAVISGEQAEAIEKQNSQLEAQHAIIDGKIRSDLIALAPLVSAIGLAWGGVEERALGAGAAMVKAYSDFVNEAGKLATATAPKGAGLGQQAATLGGNFVGRFNTALTHPTTDALQLLGFDGGILNMGMPTNHGPTPPAGEHKPEAKPDVGAGERTRAQTERAAKATDDLSKALEQYVTHTSHAAEMSKRIAGDRANGAVISSSQESSLMGAARKEDAKFGEGAAKKAEAAAQKAADQTKSDNDAIAAARKAQLQAQVAITGDLLAQHALKLQELADTKAAKDQQLKDDVATKKLSPAAASTAQGINNATYSSQVTAENNNYAKLVAENSRQFQTELAKYQIQTLTAQASQASTAEQWAAATKAAFMAQQQIDKGDFLSEINQRLTEAGKNHLTQAQADALIAAQAKADDQATADKNREINLEVLQRRKEFADTLLGFQTSTLESESSMAKTQEQRDAIELELLAIRQKQAREATDEYISKNHVDTANATVMRSSQSSQQDAEKAAMAEQQKRANNPLYAYANPLQSVNTDLQNVAVKGLGSLTDGITDAIMHTKSLGAAFHEIAQSIIADLVKIAVQRLITNNLASALFGGTSGGDSVGGFFGHLFGGHASGTDSSPGGLGLVGENGPELVQLPRGAQVLPNNLLRNAINTPSGGGVQQTSYNLTTVVNADQSVMTSHIQGWIAAAHQSAIATATQASARQGAMANRNSLIR